MLKTKSIYQAYTHLMKLHFIAFLIIFTMFTICCNISFSDDASKSEYVIGPGDVIQVSVWQYDQFNGTMTVGPDGKITMNLLGDIPIAGLTREQAKKEITERLSKFVIEGAEVTVSVVQFNSQKILVIGAVTTPQTITFSTPPSIIEAVMVQSMPASNADLTAVQIIRADSTEPITVNLNEALQSGKTVQLPKLRAGDTIFVPKKKEEALPADAEEPAERVPRTVDDTSAIPTSQTPQESAQEEFVIHVIGEVRTPSSYNFSKAPSLTEVLLQAGSVLDSTTLKYVRIIRGDPDTEDKVLHVDMEKYLTEGDSSLLPKLYSGDTVYIPDVTYERMKDVSIIVTGEVLNPGTYRTRGSMSILDAISLAGGLTEDADTENIRLTKENDDSYQEKIVNIDEFLGDIGSTSIPETVGPGYRVYVPAERRTLSSVGSATRGVVALLADLALVYSFWRVLGD
jgi:protein involved in polysaccharide export with SLBB domain